MRPVIRVPFATLKGSILGLNAAAIAKSISSLAVRLLERCGIPRVRSGWGLTTNEDFMAKDEHNKAAEHHETAAKAHRSAAEHHGKGDHAKGKEHAASAKQHSQTAHQQSDAAHSKSQQQK
jgi:hypothetical protein